MKKLWKLLTATGITEVELTDMQLDDKLYAEFAILIDDEGKRLEFYGATLGSFTEVQRALYNQFICEKGYEPVQLNY